MSARIKDEGLERRSGGEIRAEMDGNRMRGYAIVFGRDSLDLGGFIERIRPEAVERTLRTAANVMALVGHDDKRVIASTKSGTLQLSKDGRGLRVDIDPANTTDGRDIMELVRRGDVSGMSFGFRTLEDEWHMEDGMPHRDILDMEVREVSIVAFPAYPDTDISVAKRSLDLYRAECHDLAGANKIRELRLRLARVL